MTENLLNRKAFISSLADRFNITQGEASYLSWKTGIEYDFTDSDKIIIEALSLHNDDRALKLMLEKSSKFKNFLDELQNRKEAGQSFKKP
jgi:hypothetical protein